MVSSKLGQLNLQEIPPYGSRTVDSFEKLVPIGQGTFSQVFMTKEIQTGEVVALKKIRMANEKEGVYGRTGKRHQVLSTWYLSTWIIICVTFVVLGNFLLKRSSAI